METVLHQTINHQPFKEEIPQPPQHHHYKADSPALEGKSTKTHHEDRIKPTA